MGDCRCLSADATAVVAADTTDALSTGTADVWSAVKNTDVWSADTTGKLSGPLGAQGWPRSGLREKLTFPTVSVKLERDIDFV